jgi:CheY-like chemotaxis protein/HPt (histidine-containing phosphotransfer) domain-containing protein
MPTENPHRYAVDPVVPHSAVLNASAMDLGGDGRPRSATRRVLVAEDNAVNQDLAVRMLRGRGYDADVASNGREALAALAERPYDAVLMDCTMPTLDGITATKELRRLDGPNSEIPVIALTAHAMDGDRERCVEAGMDDYLAKPIMVEEFDEILARWVPLDEPPMGRPPAAERPSPAAAHVDAEILGALRRELRENALAGLVDLFAAATSDALEELDAAVASSDAARVEQVAHRIRGGSAALGARRFTALAHELEHRAATGSLEGCSELVYRLRAAFSGACIGLRAALDAADL